MLFTILTSDYQAPILWSLQLGISFHNHRELPIVQQQSCVSMPASGEESDQEEEAVPLVPMHNKTALVCGRNLITRTGGRCHGDD